MGCRKSVRESSYPPKMNRAEFCAKSCATSLRSTECLVCGASSYFFYTVWYGLNIYFNGITKLYIDAVFSQRKQRGCTRAALLTLSFRATSHFTASLFVRLKDVLDQTIFDVENLRPRGFNLLIAQLVVTSRSG